MLTTGKGPEHQGKFAITLPVDQLQAVTDVPVIAAIKDLTPDSADRTVDIGGGCTTRKNIGVAPRVEIVYPPAALYSDSFTAMTQDPREAKLRIQWNPAAAKLPVTLVFPEPSLVVTLVGADGREFTAGSYTMGDFGSQQFANFTVRVKAKQAIADLREVVLVKLTATPADSLPQGEIKANIRTLEQKVLFDGVGLDECTFDSAQPTEVVTLPALVIRPGPGVAQSEVSLNMVNRQPQSLIGATLSAEGATINNGRMIVKGATVVRVSFTPKDAQSLTSYQKGDLTVICDVTQAAAATPVFGYGFVKDPAGHLPLIINFKPKPVFEAQLHGPDGKLVNPSQACELFVGDTVQFALSCKWNVSAIGKHVAHPFVGTIDLARKAKLQTQPAVGDGWLLDGTKARKILVNITGTALGDVDAREMEFFMEDGSMVKVVLPPLKIQKDTGIFKIAVSGADGQRLAAGATMPLAVGESRALTLRCSWTDRAVGKTLAHPLSQPLDFKVARFQCRKSVSEEWRLDSSLLAQFECVIKGISAGEADARSLEFGVMGEDVVKATLPRLTVYALALRMENAGTKKSYEMLPGKQVAISCRLKDVTVPASANPGELDALYWKCAGGPTESYNISLSSPDSEVQVVFANSRGCTSVLGDCGIDKPINIEATFSGKQKLFSATRKQIQVGVTLIPVSGATPIPVKIDGGLDLQLRVPPVIPPAFVAIGVLLLVVVIGALIISKSMGGSPKPGRKPMDDKLSSETKSSTSAPKMPESEPVTSAEDPVVEAPTNTPSEPEADDTGDRF